MNPVRSDASTLRLDGFVFADADPGGGELLTRPLRLEGGRLYLNANARAGELREKSWTTSATP